MTRGVRAHPGRGLRPAMLGAALAALLLGGCGDDGANQPPTANAKRQRLTTQERRSAERSERAIYAYCRRVAQFDQGKRKGVPLESQSRAVQAVDDLVALAREEPRAKVNVGLVGENVQLRVHIGDIAEDLQATNCDSNLIDRIDQGLATVPLR